MRVRMRAAFLLLRWNILFEVVHWRNKVKAELMAPVDKAQSAYFQSI